LDTTTHKELVQVAVSWLRNIMRCGVVFKEFKTAISEIPDAFGLKSDYSILIECKASRADFLSDRSKVFRQLPDRGVGDFRLYLCNTGIIKPEDLPDKWGLLYYDQIRNKVDRIKTPKGNAWLHSGELFRFDKNKRAEYRYMYSALRRIVIHGDLDLIYEPIDIRKVYEANGRV